MTDTNILRDRIELEPKELAIGGRRMEILCVKDLDPFIEELEKNGEQGLQNFPFWVKIWEAGIVLTDMIVHMNIDRDQKILELGAGMGITGLFLGAFGYRVTITDSNPDALELIKRNARHNRIENVHIEELNWHDPSTEDTFDTICGSELVYRKSDAEAVTNIISRLLKPEGTAYLAHDISRMSMIDFLKTAEPHFDIAHKGMSLTGGGQHKKIVVHSIKHKQS